MAFLHVKSPNGTVTDLNLDLVVTNSFEDEEQTVKTIEGYKIKRNGLIGPVISALANDQMCMISGGTGSESAYITLHGKDHPSTTGVNWTKGALHLHAKNDDNDSSLNIYANGSLIFTGGGSSINLHNALVSNDITTGSTNGTISVKGTDVTTYTHPTTAGNKHIPTGGSTGKVLKYGGSSGTASWDNIDVEDVTFENYDPDVSFISSISDSSTLAEAIGKLDQCVKLGAFLSAKSYMMKSIPDNSDLNDITEAGTWFCGSETRAQTYTNCPYTASNFKMFVIACAGADYFMQIIITPVGYIYKRAYMPSQGWTDWTNLAGNTWVSNHFVNLAGGTMTGNLVIEKASPILRLISTDIARNTAPSSDVGRFLVGLRDSNDRSIGGLYVSYKTDKSLGVRLYAYNGNTTSGDDYDFIGVGHDGSGNVTTYAPTPATSDSSTKMATTAYVKANVPKSIGGSQRPVYTNSNGVITACTATGSAGGLEGVSAKGDTYIKFVSGIKICWGSLQVSSSGTTVTFPASGFSSVPIIVASPLGHDVGIGVHTGATKTNCVISASTSSAWCRWIAVGLG